MCDVQHLIDFVLHGQAMAIPSRTTGYVMTSLAGISGNYILDSASEDMAVMWQTGGEGRSVVEGVLLFVFSHVVDNKIQMAVRWDTFKVRLIDDFSKKKYGNRANMDPTDPSTLYSKPTDEEGRYIVSLYRGVNALTLSPLSKLNASCFLNVFSASHLAQISSSVLAKSSVGGRLAMMMMMNDDDDDDDDDVVVRVCLPGWGREGGGAHHHHHTTSSAGLSLSGEGSRYALLPTKISTTPIYLLLESP